MKVMARGAAALAATVAISMGAASAAHGVRVPRVARLPRIHVHIPTGTSTHGGDNAGNCGNGGSGDSGRHGANGATNVGDQARGGKGGPGGHGAKGGKGARC